MFDSDSDEDEDKLAAGTSQKKAEPEPEPEPVSKSVSKSGGPKAVEVEFDLALSAYGNARKMYTQRKVAVVKEARTLDSSARALQSAGERALQSVENQKLKRSLRAVRKVVVINTLVGLLMHQSLSS